MADLGSAEQLPPDLMLAGPVIAAPGSPVGGAEFLAVPSVVEAPSGPTGEPQLTGQLWPRGAVASDVPVVPPPPATVRSGSYVNGGGAGVTTFTPTFPAGVVTGDRLILVMAAADSALGSAITPVTTGWTVAVPIADQGTMQRAMYWADYSPSLVAPTWTLSQARRCGFLMVAVKDAVAQSYAYTDLATSTQNVVAPNQLIGRQDLWLRFYTRKDNLSTSVTPPAGYTLVTGALGVPTGPSLHMLAYSMAGTDTSPPSATATFSVASANGTGFTVSLDGA